MNHFTKVTALGIALLAIAPAQAFVWTIDDIMDGSQEVPPVNTPATGMIMGTYNDVTNVLDITITFQDLTSNQVAAHVHDGARGTNGGIIFDIGVGNPKQLVANLSEAQEARLLGGFYYVNVHTVNFRGGEIRGQINPVPEPATMIALGAGLASVAARRRRKA